MTSVLDKEFIETTLQEQVQNRGSEIIKKKGFSSVNSAAQAICLHLKDWDSESFGFTSNMAVYVESIFNDQKGVFSSLPIKIENGINFFVKFYNI